VFQIEVGLRNNNVLYSGCGAGLVGGTPPFADGISSEFDSPTYI